MYEQTAVKSGEHDSFETDAEHVMPPELPTQDSALEDSVGQLSRVQNLSLIHISEPTRPS